MLIGHPVKMTSKYTLINYRGTNNSFKFLPKVFVEYTQLILFRAWISFIHVCKDMHIIREDFKVHITSAKKEILKGNYKMRKEDCKSVIIEGRKLYVSHK